MALFQELWRRKIFRVAAIYAVTAWLIAQIVEVINDPLHLPGSFDTAVIVLLIIGFPVVLMLAYAFEVAPEGVVRRMAAVEGEPAVRPLLTQ